MSHLLSVDALSFSYGFQKRKFFKNVVGNPALVDVSFELAEGESLGIVGESGSGKSTLARLLLRLLQPNQGQILYRSQDAFSKAYKRRDYAKCVQLIFQDPLSSLNPRRTVLQTLMEVLVFHQKSAPKKNIQAQAINLLSEVGLNESSSAHYPHELSGGQRQRLAIARALAVRPELLVADEVVSALDVSVQAQIIQLIQTLLKEHELSLIFISHDLAVVQQLTSTTLVMFQGRIVEILPSEKLDQARHPYTQSLLKAIPVLDPRQRRTHSMCLDREVSLSGCPFLSRCNISSTRCQDDIPPLINIGKNQKIACWNAE
ncbi:ABC transporter ATP-binding protein [Piscirickettsia litoralis]|uniref:Peptide ABC transporter ATP-binding protein n=1 Tax=Piscirickettsia litoralis TaxID=1891921 RepID=A0ABX3A420_9GAMM|nr:ABC transporter ATP-binding protein [Piscirickettsia litoralis]ODN43616.1 peptide ABC transporter ATP-binding protein [Piscirickettsia litoralis]